MLKALHLNSIQFSANQSVKIIHKYLTTNMIREIDEKGKIFQVTSFIKVNSLSCKARFLGYQKFCQVIIKEIITVLIMNLISHAKRSHDKLSKKFPSALYQMRSFFYFIRNHQWEAVLISSRKIRTVPEAYLKPIQS